MTGPELMLWWIAVHDPFFFWENGKVKFTYMPCWTEQANELL
jgi:hypothetical protein